MTWRGLSLQVFLLLLTMASGPAQAASGERSRILLRLDCSSQIGRQDLTLFANGTVRLREQVVAQDQLQFSDLGQPIDPEEGALHMYLGELSPEELQGYLRRFGKENLRESEETTDLSIGGAWIEECRLELHLPGQPSRNMDFRRYDSLSLGTAQVVRIARELLEKVDRNDSLEPAFPPEYIPARGDVLERLDGYKFKVVRYTYQGGGVELEGIDQPVTIYINKDNLRAEFRRLLRREN